MALREWNIVNIGKTDLIFIVQSFKKGIYNKRRHNVLNTFIVYNHVFHLSLCSF
jgi:hypothetical protein